MIPALLYRASTLPQVAIAWSTMRFAPSSPDTSAATAVACPPAARTSAATDSAISSVTSTQTTRAPSAANIEAAFRPMPPPAPVMIVTLSARRTVGRPPGATRPATAGADRTRWYSRSDRAEGPPQRLGSAVAEEPLLDDRDRGLQRTS